MDGREVAPHPARTVWTAGQVAKELSIADATLRSWHRRYGVGPQPARPGQYRRYTAEDIARLRRMRDLIAAGVLPSDAARTVEPFPAMADAPEQVLDAVLTAARQLDSSRCLALLCDAFTRLGVAAGWDRICRPALLAVDADQGDGCVDSEHALSWAVTAALHRVDRPSSSTPAVLLACVDTEQHTLPLEALAAALAEQGTPVRMLGAAVPTATLVHAVETTRPAVVVLWAQREEAAHADTVVALRGFPLFPVVAGPGWPRRPVAGAELVTSLAAAVSLVAGRLRKGD